MGSSRTAYLCKQTYELYEKGHTKEYILEQLELSAIETGKWSGFSLDKRQEKLKEIINYVIWKKNGKANDDIINDTEIQQRIREILQEHNTFTREISIYTLERKLVEFVSDTLKKNTVHDNLVRESDDCPPD